MSQIKGGFTVEQVAHLDAHQRGGQFHPFTCANRGDGKHGDVDGDTGTLVPTVRGWICRYCDYTQDWAHNFMCEPPSPCVMCGHLPVDHIVRRECPVKVHSPDLLPVAVEIIRYAYMAADKIVVERERGASYYHAEVDWLVKLCPEMLAWLRLAGSSPGIDSKGAAVLDAFARNELSNSRDNAQYFEPHAAGNGQ